MVLISLCAETSFGGGQNLTAVEGNASVYQVYSVRRTTGEGRAEFYGRWGLGVNKRERGGGWGWAGQLNLWAETRNPLIGHTYILYYKHQQHQQGYPPANHTPCD